MHLRHRQRKHQNILLLILSIITAIIFVQTPLFSHFLIFIHQFPYVAAFLAGILFASTFTAVAGGIVIINLITTIPTIWLVLLTSLGAVCFDLTVFSLVKDRFHLDTRDVYRELQHLGHFGKIIHTKYFAWTIPVIGALTFISPLPDELGIELLNISHVSLFRFFFISYIAHLFNVSGLIFGMSLL